MSEVDDESGTNLLEEMVAAIGEAMKTIPVEMREDTGPFDPPPWPREQMTVMFRFLNTDAGMPQRCPRRGCRRSGQCQGGFGRENGASCAELWDDELARMVFAAFLALGVGWVYESQRKGALVHMLAGGTFAQDEFPAGAARQ